MTSTTGVEHTDSARAGVDPGFRIPRGYQERRLLLGCALLAAWAGCCAVARNIVVGSLLLVVLGAVAVVGATCLGRRAWGRAALRALRARPWRDTDETLDIAAARLHDVVRRTLTGERSAPSTVVVTLDPAALLRLSATIGIAAAERELGQRYDELLRALDVTMPGGVRVVVHGSAAHARGHVTVSGRLAASGVPSGPADATALLEVRADASYDHGDSATDVDTPHALRDRIHLEFAGGVAVFDASVSSFTIGRSAACDVALPTSSTQVSRCHAVVDRAPAGGWWLRPCGANGTTVDGRVTSAPVELSDGSTITFGTNLWSATVRLT